MANIFLCIMFACMFAQYFYISFNVQVLNNVVDNMPLDLVLACVDNTTEPPCINVETLEDYVKRYYDYYLPNLAHDVFVDPYSVEGDIKLAEGDDTTGVNITLVSNFSMFYTYSNTMFYEIIGGLYD